MSEQDRKRLREIQTFPALVKYLREDLKWPVDQESFHDLDEITFDWEADELGIDPDQAAKIEYIKQLRPLEHGQPQGVFFVKFAAKNLPVVALRRLLSKLVVKKRASAGAGERPLWTMRDLVFISSYGGKDERQLSFAYFQEPEQKNEMPSLKVLGWEDGTAALQLDRVHDQLAAHLTWPDSPKALTAWRRGWSAAFELRHGEVVTTAKQLAERLAVLARAIRDRAQQLLKLETATGPLRTLLAGFKKALIHDLTEDQFADMYAQTIAYGLLSARITHPDPVKAETLPDLIPVTNPFLKELMETFVLAGGKYRGRKRGLHLDFDELGINDVVELLRLANMEAVLRNFGADDRKEDPVTYFYEDFLNAYDQQERKRRGVYYTPKPVVSYIVRSVHELLQTEFGIEDGLASTITWGEMATRHENLKIPRGTAAHDPFVQILDPATGTATFLVTVIEVIFETLTARWKREGLSAAKQVEAWNAYIPKYLLPRLYGYELMMAPYAIAHLKIGLKLFETGYRFGSQQRARIFLTNALDPASDASASQIDALSDALAHESMAVNAVKRQQQFSVVFGNPPYSLISANMAPAHRALIERYKSIEGKRLRERGALQLEKILNDDYVKFLAKAEDAITSAGAGVVALITNHAYLDNPTMRGLRHSVLATFDDTYFYDLGGSAKKATDETDSNAFDIQQGVAICILSKGIGASRRQVSYKRLRGGRDDKYRVLRESSIRTPTWTPLNPTSPHFLFVPTDYVLGGEYAGYCSLSAIFPVHSIGLFTSKDHFVIADEPASLVANAKAFRDSNLSDTALCAKYELNAKAAWNVGKSRRNLREMTDADIASDVLQFTHRPFDSKFIFYNRALVWSMAYPVNRNLVHGGNLALVTSRQLAVPPWTHAFCSNAVVEMFLMSNKTKEGNHVFPLWLVPEEDGRQRAFGDDRRRPNLGTQFLRDLACALEMRSSGVDGLPPGLTPQDVFHYTYAVFHDPGYRTRYVEFLKIDFPRVPLPGSFALFRGLAHLGNELVTFHLLEARKLKQFNTTYVGPKNPEVGRIGWSDETVWIDAEAPKKRQQAIAGTIGFEGVSEAVWNFRIGCYQVCEKWLKDRRGRTLSKDDIEHYQKIVGAISETIRIMDEIGAFIEQHGGWPGAFKAAAENARC